jgi:hypothetical protein
MSGVLSPFINVMFCFIFAEISRILNRSWNSGHCHGFKNNDVHCERQGQSQLFHDHFPFVITASNKREEGPWRIGFQQQVDSVFIR